MKIECKIQRKGGTHVDMGTAKYHFAPQDDGAHVAEVLDEAHQDRFLSITEGYRLYRPGQPAASVEVLLGSSEHPATFTIHDKDYALGDIVAMAHKDSGLSTEEWNELEESTRADMIDEALDKLEAAGKKDQTPGETRADLAAQYKGKFGKGAPRTMTIDDLRAALAAE